MRRILLTIEYDGNNYSGWQKQPNQRTIQGEIESAIERAFGQQIEIFGSGRTDAKVHALNQKAHFDLSIPVPTKKIAKILNNFLPKDIVIKKAEEVDIDFHARFSLKKKTYLYKIYNNENPNAFLSKYTGWVKQKLNVKKIKQIAKIFIGEHDFQGFCSANTNSENFVRTIYKISVKKKKDIIFIEVTGSGFLYNMVRILVGTMIDYSLSKIKYKDIQTALLNGDRTKAGQTMAPFGLYLKEAEY